MNRRKAIAALMVAVIYIVSFGSVRAFSPQPGSADDPLITQSYVRNIVQPLLDRIDELEEAVALLDTAAEDLQQAELRIKMLEEQVAKILNQPAPAPVTPPPTVTPPTPPPAPVYGFINANWVNIRSGPGTNFSVIVTLPQNTRVEVVQRGAEWHTIKHNDRIGHVFAPLLRIP